MKDRFSAEDFAGEIDDGIRLTEVSREWCADKANAWLEARLGAEVRCDEEGFWFDADRATSSTDTHTAHLFNVQPIELTEREPSIAESKIAQLENKIQELRSEVDKLNSAVSKLKFKEARF